METTTHYIDSVLKSQADENFIFISSSEYVGQQES